MTLLHIALQEGFVDDDVVIKVNRTKVYQKNMVKTRFQIGLADYVDLDISKKKATITVSLPSKDLSNSIQVDLSSPVYLGVSITMEHQVDFKVSSTPYGYV